MIFYFTGTGNSLYAAGKIAKSQRDRVFSIAKLMAQRKDVYHYELGENELLGFVFPVFAWGPPKIVLDFIDKLEVEGNPYVFSLSTCADEEGNTTKILRKALAAKGCTLDSAFTIKMPNNYIIGNFDVTPKEAEAKILKAAELMLAEINKTIRQRKKNIDLTLPGKHPGMKTAVINRMFNLFARRTEDFTAGDTCTGCGVCEKICPVNTIKIEDGKPVWGENCTQCLACINRCPVQAIQYGKGTGQKGRYVHPDLAHLEQKYTE